MAHNPVIWFEIYVQDLARAKAFYESVFQVKLETLGNPDSEMCSFTMEANGQGASGALVRKAGVPSGGNSTLVYFSCKDCAVEAARVAKAGGSVKQTKVSIGQYGFIALAVDTEGNLIGLHSMQ